VLRRIVGDSSSFHRGANARWVLRSISSTAPDNLVKWVPAIAAVVCRDERLL
jgi:hypothetical protein